jgi:hypothetical protein
MMLYDVVCCRMMCLCLCTYRICLMFVLFFVELYGWYGIDDNVGLYCELDYTVEYTIVDCNGL